jgi:antitoxin FitA
MLAQQSEFVMAQIIVREIEEEVKQRLQRRAAQNGRSMEEEVRDILRDAVKRDGQPERGLGTEIAALFTGIGLKETEGIHELRGFKLHDPLKP